jgi:hypothetical protein
MINEDKIPRSRIFHLLMKIPMILGCTIFLLSVVFPYHHLVFVVGNGFEPSISSIHIADVWSFKATVYNGFVATQTGARDYWFFENWFYNEVPELRWTNIAILTVQVMTVMIGVISVFIDRKVFAFVPLVLCFVIAALMLNVEGSPLWGYYLILLSIIPFLIAFMMELASSRRSRHT